MDNKQIEGKKVFASIIGKEVNGLLDRLNLATAAFTVMESQGDMDETLNLARIALIDAGTGMVAACELINSFVMDGDEETNGQDPTN